MPPAVIAGVGAAASIGGAVMGASATKKAAGKAADTSIQTAQMNNALTQQIYQQNSANMQPFMANGLAASNALSGMLLGTPQTGAAPSAPQLAAQPAPTYANPAITTDQIRYSNGKHYGPDGTQLEKEYVRGLYERMDAPIMAMSPGNALAPMHAQPPAAPQPVTGAPAQSPWDQFRNSTNYQFRLNEGLKAANQGYAARGMLESGAAQKGLLKYGQEFASNELGNYMGMLTNQQNMGMSGASALAGVGQNMVSNVTANNNAAGTAAANAQLMAGTANAGMWGGIANGIGNALGSSYGMWR